MGKLYIQLSEINRVLRAHNFEGHYIVSNDNIIPVGIGNKTKSFLCDYYDMNSYDDIIVEQDDETEYDLMFYDDDENEDLDVPPETLDMDDDSFDTWVRIQMARNGGSW